MRTLGMSLGMAQRATASGARLFEILDREPQITAARAPAPLPEGRGRVELRDVTLRYDGAARDAAQRRRPRRRRRARPSRSSARPARARRRSSSSCRASTTSTAGAVLVDGVDVRDVDPAALRSQIAVVDDDPFLFSATVRENIAYARPDATDARGRGGRAPRAGRTTSSSACPTATTRASASAA